MFESFICPICGNSDINAIGFKNGKAYCRKCIVFRGENINYVQSLQKPAPISLNYELSSEQNELSNRLISNFKNNVDSLVYAVCGSGKTEICLGVIAYAIKMGLKVGFGVPRRTVCYELYCRFKNIFRENSVVAVYGGNHQKVEGDIVCLTTHQLFRYNNYFDLLILDEMDAFPFKGNDVLNRMFFNSIRGHYILLSATPDEKLLNEFQKPGKDLLKLFVRFHRHSLPVPKMIIGSSVKLYYKLFSTMKDFFKNKKQVFLFVPTIDDSIKLSLLLKPFFPKGTYVNSKRDNNELIIEDFRLQKYDYLVSTAVLERGITVKDLQVIVFGADSSIYDDHSLIQIAGRAGRKKEAPEGEVIFFAKRKTKYMERAVNEIVTANESLQNMLQNNQK